MSVSIIGCGWLGQALAIKLQEQNIDVIASYQSQQTFEKLSTLGIKSKQLLLPLDQMEPANADGSINVSDFIDDELFKKTTLVIAIPPQIKKGQTNYAIKIAQLVSLAEQGQVKRIILLNSTAIYNGLHGNVDENSVLDYSASKVYPLVEAERALQKFTGQHFILRLSGLVGPQRHPGKFLQLKREFANANSQVNLVHQTDVVNIIIQLYEEPVDMTNSDIYNVVSNTASNRQEYYQTAAKELNLPMPIFSVDNEVMGKKVNGKKLRAALSYQYVYDDLLTWLAQDETIRGT